MPLISNNRLKKLYDSDPPEYSEAIAIQKELRYKVIYTNGFDNIKTVAGADLAILKDQNKLV
ncbi:MAG: hypothetical protein WD000_10455 [Thermodesulfobacteriota bacterium]